MKIADHFGSRDNNYNLLRFFAATIVIYTHSWVLLGSPETSIINTWLGLSPGAMAVDSFFIISGLLVAHSWLRQPTLTAFVNARVLRVFPGLLLVLLVTVFVVGPLCTTLPMGQYFQEKETWEYLYKNFFMFHTEYELPGVFKSSPHDQGVNGSLWTLKFELKMYLGVCIAGLVGAFSNRRIQLLLIGGYFAWYFSHHVMHVMNPELAVNTAMMRVSLFFMLGLLARLYAKHIELSLGWLVALILLACLLRTTLLADFFFSLALTHLVFCAAYFPGKWIRKFNNLGDYSYGTYLYAFPIQQILIQFVPGMEPMTLFFLATPISWLCGVCSWHLCEKPALQTLKK